MSLKDIQYSQMRSTALLVFDNQIFRYRKGGLLRGTARMRIFGRGQLYLPVVCHHAELVVASPIRLTRSD